MRSDEMQPQTYEAGRGVVQIRGPEDGWILQRIARRLADKLPYASLFTGPRAAPPAALVYYVNYALYLRPSGGLDVAFVTHPDEQFQFLERARRVDHCVCMAKQYEDWLRARGVLAVSWIPMGFDAVRYRPRLTLGVVGRLDHPRKGRHLVEEVRKLPFVELITTEGRVSESDLLEVYRRLDYVLIPATEEGGPMSILEGLGAGKPVIAPDTVGVVPEFSDTEHIRRYPSGDVAALLRVVRECYREKCARSDLVRDRSWDRWAEAHHRLFRDLLRGRGVDLPEPHAGFRFGMMGELDVPLGDDPEPLERAVDAAARELYFGCYAAARARLEAVLPRFPCAAKLLDSIPRGPEVATVATEPPPGPPGHDGGRPPAPAATPLRSPGRGVNSGRIVVATRSMSEHLYRLSGDLLQFDAAGAGAPAERWRFVGTDAADYFREMARVDADWVVNIDEDVFVINPAGLLGLVRYMADNGYAACGVPDGGVLSIRRHNPAACNAFFNVFDLRRVRRAWSDWDRVLKLGHRPEYEQAVAAFARRTAFAFDNFEPYYGVFFSLLDAGERVLYLNAEEWQDGVTSLVKDWVGEPLLLHGWYGRTWETSADTRNRYLIAINYARWRQGLPRLQQESLFEPAVPGPPGATSLGKWEAHYRANPESAPFGDTVTYEKAAAFLGDLRSVEDWGCGTGWFRKYLKPAVRYRGIDGSRGSGVDVVADLAQHTSAVEGILVRHVLEHNDNWAVILRNALTSFSKRMVLVLFTPFAETTRRIAFHPAFQVPDIAFAKSDLIKFFDTIRWSLEEGLPTRSQYGVEHVFYLEKQNDS